MNKDRIDEYLTEEIGGKKAPSKFAQTMGYIQNDDLLSDAFCYNAFTGDVEHAKDNPMLSPQAKKGSSVNDTDITCLRAYLTNKYKFTPVRTDIDDALTNIAMLHTYHPIKEYLEKTKWDGIERLDRWLIEVCGAPDNDYTKAVGRKMFVAAVKRIYEPGCYYAQLVILEGKQRIYKSRLVKAMGADWYASIQLKTHDTKQVVEDIRGKWILEVEELAGFSKQDTEHMKAFISRQHDRVRISYARRADDYPRQSIMIATMNPDEGENKYLVDRTGNVRYWPIKCSNTHIQIDMFEDIRDQLFAEALVLYKRGESLWLEDSVASLIAEQEQSDRVSDDAWEEPIRKWLEAKELSGIEHKITNFQVLEECMGMAKDRVHSGHTRRVGLILTKLGWIRKRETTKNDRSWYYTPPKSSNKTINVDWES